VGILILLTHCNKAVDGGPVSGITVLYLDEATNCLARVGIRSFLSAYCLREPPLLTITELAGIAFAIFFRFIPCSKGNEDTCMRTCCQLTSNAIQGYANRRNINNQPPSSLPRLQHALLLTPASVAALGHSTRCNNIDKGDARALYYANSILRGSSMYSFTLTRKVTASRPSNIRWSYVSATTITGLITICPFTTTGRSFVACIPSTAD